jgi:hypothetical protein
MSKGLKKVVAVGAMIAIPFAAPAIVSSIAASGALGSALTGALGTSAGFTIGSGLTGAALGAGTAALTGGDVGRSALFGGLGGAAGGFMQGAPGVAAPSGAGPIPQGAVNYSAGAGTAVPDLGSISASVGAPTSTFSPIGAVTPSAAQTTANVVRAAAPQSFGEALRRVPQAVAARFRDPNALADLTLRGAGLLAGSAIAGDGLSPQEQQLLQAQRQELEWLRENNQAEFNRRLSEAQQLLGEARYFDPEYFGLQAARRQQTAGAVAERAGLRGLTGAAREAEQRRYRLGTARSAGTAYDVGFGQGVQSRTQLQQAGLSALPQPSQYTTGGGFSTLAQAYGQAGQRGQQQARDIGTLFGAITGAPRSAEEE